MLKILHKGLQPSIDLDVATAPGGLLEADLSNEYLTSLVSGRLVALDANGNAKLADGAADFSVGFIINDAIGNFYENKPAWASGKLPVTLGNCVVVTDQIADGITVAPGEKLYAGTGDNSGLVTNVDPTGVDATGRVIGVAGSSASPAEPELTIYV